LVLIQKKIHSLYKPTTNWRFNCYPSATHYDHNKAPKTNAS